MWCSIICSDAMARGMDLEEVEGVFNYDAPEFIKTYIHRVGRTARAGREGSAFTLITEDEVAKFNDIRSKAASSREVQHMQVGTEQVEHLIAGFSVWPRET
jgi:ATP-dependent RNA helicase DDX51/DBP6